MAILFIPGKFDPKPWVDELLKADPTLDLRVWPNVGNPKEIDFALAWHYPPGELKKYPNLKCISSLGAGVDHILEDSDRPKNVPIVRVMDKLLVRDMTQYIVYAVLYFTRKFDVYTQQQQQKKWLQLKPNNELTTGIMGLGQLGTDAAKKLKHLGFKVIGWSRSPKKIAGIKCFHGEQQLNQFLSRAHILVNLLPLTADTQNILNAQIFNQLPPQAYVINVGRGKHLVEEDLLTAIETGHIAGAFLDVFQTEPLPENNSIWEHSKIKITPHIASITTPHYVAKQIVENYHRMLQGKPLLHRIDIRKGY